MSDVFSKDQNNQSIPTHHETCRFLIFDKMKMWNVYHVDTLKVCYYKFNRMKAKIIINVLTNLK